MLFQIRQHCVRVEADGKSFCTAFHFVIAVLDCEIAPCALSLVYHQVMPVAQLECPLMGFITMTVIENTSFMAQSA